MFRISMGARGDLYRLMARTAFLLHKELLYERRDLLGL
jgi:hypothetical protein